MSKPQALTWAIVCGLAALFMAIVHWMLLAACAVIVAACCAAVYGYKVWHHVRLLEAAKKDAATVTPEPVTMTSPGVNGRLFVPPSLDR